MTSLNGFDWGHSAPLKAGQSMAGLSVDEILTKANLDWAVVKEPIYTQVDGAFARIPGRFSLQRETDHTDLSIVGTNYKPIQNREWLQFAHDFASAGDATIENAGTFGNGKFVFAMLNLGKTFNLRRNKKGDADELGGYAVLVQPHVFAYGAMMLATSVRFACFNALPRLISKAQNGKDGSLFRMSHSRKFTPEMQDYAKRSLGIASDNISVFNKEATKLAGARAGNDEVKAYFENVINFDRTKAEKAAKEAKTEVKDPRVLEKFAAALNEAPGAQLTTAQGTWWGAFNAVTYVADHMIGHGKEAEAVQSALGSSLIGDRANMKRRALQLALEHAA